MERQTKATNAFVRLNANPNYWGGKPAFETVVYKFVPDATSRVAEVESGASDITLDVPYEEYDRLKAKDGLNGVTTPISDIGMIFLNDVGPMEDKNVRMAAAMSINKKAIVDWYQQRKKASIEAKPSVFTPRRLSGP